MRKLVCEMLPGLVVVVVFVVLFSNVVSQFVPIRARLYQYDDISMEELRSFIQYDLTPETIRGYLGALTISDQSNRCDDQFNTILDAGTKKDLWAMKILDAWGKPLPSGIMKGNIYWVGDYNECVQPMYYSLNRSYLSQPIDTQHCEGII